MDASGAVAASYAYDTWGALTSASETIPNAHGWTNPYRYDGRDGVRYDRATGLSWMSVRAYDPTVGRFLSRDPLGRAPLFLADAPYAYAGNTPLSNIDPSGQRYTMSNGSGDPHAKHSVPKTTRTTTRKGSPKKQAMCKVCRAEGFAGDAGWWFGFFGGGVTLAAAGVGILSAVLQTEAAADFASVIAAALGIAVEALVAQLNVIVAVLTAIAAVAALLVTAFSWEATRPDSWWSSDKQFDGFAHIVMSGLQHLQALALTASMIMAQVLKAAGALAAAVKANFGLLAGVAIALVAVTAMEGEAKSTLRQEASVFGWSFSW